MFTVSAPGKLMLLGEHAVVYGQPCLVTAVNQRLYVTIDASDGGIVIDAPQVKDTTFVDAAMSKFFGGVGRTIKIKNIRLTIKSDFSQTVGFGSSSAVTVATLKALSVHFKVPLTPWELFDLAYHVVIDVQSVGSGFDIAASVFGGTLLFKKAGEILEQLPNSPLLVVGYSGTKADTTTMVAHVAELRKQYPERVNRIFTAIGSLVSQGREAIMSADWPRLGTLFNFNQEYLRDLGVSTQKLEDLISAAKKGGALGAKLSGAGGGDCMIALATSDKRPASPAGRQAIRKAITNTGGQVIEVVSHAEGVRIENNK